MSGSTRVQRFLESGLYRPSNATIGLHGPAHAPPERACVTLARDVHQRVRRLRRSLTHCLDRLGCRDAQGRTTSPSIFGGKEA